MGVCLQSPLHHSPIAATSCQAHMGTATYVAVDQNGSPEASGRLVHSFCLLFQGPIRVHFGNSVAKHVPNRYSFISYSLVITCRPRRRGCAKSRSSPARPCGKRRTKKKLDYVKKI